MGEPLHTRCRVLLLGATGTMGRATARALQSRGHDVVCFVRTGSGASGPSGGPSAVGRHPGSPDGSARHRRGLPDEVEVRAGDVADPVSVRQDGFRGERFDAVVSCMASRTGSPADAWAVDHRAHLNVLEAAGDAGVEHFVLLSAICVQKPRLEFQFAKLAFEEALRRSGLTYSIVRATAFFKSLSGQVKRVREGKPFLVFGDGRLNACKPIGDSDLAAYLVRCLEDPDLGNRTLPVGGPGPALTPRDQGELLFRVAGREPRFREVPVGLLDVAVAALGLAGRLVPALATKAELARIGRYYATESMLVWDAEGERYDADATPEFGSETLGDYYARMLRGEIADERGEHAVF